MDGITPETCDECGFGAPAWRVRDAETLLGALGTWWRIALDGIDARSLNTRPAPTVWSALEYGAHSALVTAMVRWGLEQTLAADGVELPAPPTGTGARADDETITLDSEKIVADLEREGAALAGLAHSAPRDAWTNVARLPDGVIQAEAALFHAAHDASHHMFDVSRGLQGLGAGAQAQHGQVASVNASDGGVPKRSIGGADVTWSGLHGDRQADRKHHGRPFQALSLWSREVIAGFAADGHPIESGSAGENVTLTGLDWHRLRPGALVRIGTALVEISFPATPCQKQTRWFSDGDFNHIAYERDPGKVRWYAWVREPGHVDEGDAVTVQP